MIFLKRTVRKHLKSIFALLILSLIYSVIAINGYQFLGEHNSEQDIDNIAFSVIENKVSCEIPQNRYIILKLSNLPEKQETVTFHFYDDEKQLIDSKEVVLCNNINNIGQIDTDAAFFKYSSRYPLSINALYCTNQMLFDKHSTVQVFLGIFLLGLIQYSLTLVRRKYAQ